MTVVSGIGLVDQVAKRNRRRPVGRKIERIHPEDVEERTSCTWLRTRCAAKD